MSYPSAADEDVRPPASVRFGIRTVEARDRRIWLNGEPIFLKGVNRHEQNGEFGATTSEAQMVRDLQLVESLNANFVRGAHYQQSQRFLDLCDEMGVLVWEESLGWGNGLQYTRQYDKIDELSDEGFRAAQIHETRERVRASFNHPSVILFGFLNECASGRLECKSLVDALIDAIKTGILRAGSSLISPTCEVKVPDTPTTTARSSPLRQKRPILRRTVRRTGFMV